MSARAGAIALSRVWQVVLLAAALLLVSGQGCPLPGPAPGGSTYNNTTDPTNGNARFVGASACRACHPEVADRHSLHGHAYKLTKVEGQPPVFPEAARSRAIVPQPPDGFGWDDISYVIGGYTKKARFIDHDGFILVTGVAGVATQWNLDFPANGTQPGFTGYESEARTRKPYDYSCFVCHTTGAQPQNEDYPVFQENRPGFIGTWEEPGIQCEACHGPGSNHVPNPSARDMFVSTEATSCGACHDRPYQGGGTSILASGGFIQHHEQYPELRASGGHAELECLACHDPHAGPTYDRARAMRSECQECHPGLSMALHEGITLVRGDYTEALRCESCHMPYATRSATAAPSSVAGAAGRIGDTKTHIFRINTDPVDYRSMFTADLKQVVTDGEGRAAVTVDFVCLRCHNDIGNAFSLTVRSASEIARVMHQAGR